MVPVEVVEVNADVTLIVEFVVDVRDKVVCVLDKDEAILLVVEIELVGGVSWFFRSKVVSVSGVKLVPLVD